MQFGTHPIILTLTNQQFLSHTRPRSHRAGCSLPMTNTGMNAPEGTGMVVASADIQNWGRVEGKSLGGGSRKKNQSCISISSITLLPRVPRWWPCSIPPTAAPLSSLLRLNRAVTSTPRSTRTLKWTPRNERAPPIGRRCAGRAEEAAN